MAAITSAATGNSNATGTWTGGVIPVEGDNVTIQAGHTVTIVGTHVWGNDTATAALTIAGTVQFDTAANTDLRCKGDIVNSSTTGRWIRDLSGSPTIISRVRSNYSATPANLKYGMKWGVSTRFAEFTEKGTVKTRWTTLTAQATAGATSATVALATGWRVGDIIMFAASSTTRSQTEAVVLTSVTGTTIGWTGGLINTHINGWYVANLTSNVRWLEDALTTYSQVRIALTASMSAGIVTMTDVAFHGMAGNNENGALYLTGNTFYSSGSPWGTMARIAVSNWREDGALTHTGNAQGIAISGVTTPPTISDTVVAYRSGTGSSALCACSGGAVRYLRCLVANATNGFISFFSQGGIASVVDSCVLVACDQALAHQPSINTEYTSCVMDACGRLLNLNAGASNLTNCTIGNVVGFSDTATISLNNASAEVLSFTNCAIDPSATFAPTTITNTSTATRIRIRARGSVATAHEDWMKTGPIYRDGSTINYSRSSIRFEPYIAATAHGDTYAITGGTAGVPMTVRGYLRFDTTYGTATPPSVTFSGQGSTPASFTAPATANTWWPFTLTVTPVTSGDMSLAVSGTSAATTGKYWLSGVSISPWVDWSQHYGYTYAPASPVLTVDPIVQLSESAAGALTGISFGSNTLTLTSNKSIREIYDWMKWYEASNRLDPIITSSDGSNFTLAASLTQSGGNITGTGRLTLTAGKTHTPNSNTSDVIISSDAGTTGIITITAPSGSSIVVYKTDGSREQYIASGSTATSRVPAGITGSRTYKVAKYGSLSASGSVVVTGGGYLSSSVSLSVDAGITQSTVATVAAYTTLETLDKVYDYAAYNETLTGGIDYVRPFAKAASAVDAGTRAVVIDASPASVYIYAGAGVTIKASALADGVTFTSLTTTGSVSYLNGATFNTIISSLEGTTGKLTFSGLSSHNLYIENATPTQVDYQTGISSYILWIAAGSTGTWRWRAVKYGNIPATGTFSVASGGRLTADVPSIADASITQATLATVLAYTTLENWDKVYDYCQAYLTTSGGKALGQFATKNGQAVDLGAYNLTVDSAAASVFALSTGITIKATNLIAGNTFAGMITTGSISTLGAARVDTWYSTSAGRSVLILAPNIMENSRVLLYNQTALSTIDNSVIGTGGVRYRITWTSDVTIKLTTTCIDCVPLVTTGVLSNTGVTFLSSQTTDDVYTANGISGASCDSSNGGEFTADIPNIQIDINDSDNSTDLARTYAWAKYYETTEAGISSFLNCITATDTASYYIDGSVVDVAFDNKKTSLLTIGGGFITKTGGTSLVASTTTGSIYFDSGKAYVVAAGSLAKESSVQLAIALSA